MLQLYSRSNCAFNPYLWQAAHSESRILLAQLDILKTARLGNESRGFLLVFQMRLQSLIYITDRLTNASQTLPRQAFFSNKTFSIACFLPRNIGGQASRDFSGVSIALSGSTSQVHVTFSSYVHLVRMNSHHLPMSSNVSRHLPRSSARRARPSGATELLSSRIF
jgi:hypothetical protein